MLEEWSLAKSTWDAHEVNLAGLQRTLSERLVHLMLAVSRAPHDQESKDMMLLERTMSRWRTTHYGLWHGNEAQRLPGARGAQAQQIFDELLPVKKSLSRSVQDFIDLWRTPGWDQARAQAARAALRQAQDDQRRFVTMMDNLVTVLEHDAVERLAKARTLDAAVVGTIILVLILLGVFILRPAARHMRRTMERSERERLGLAAFVRDSPTPIMQFKPDGRLVGCNLGAEKLLAQVPGPGDDLEAKARTLFKDCLREKEFRLPSQDLEAEVGGRYYLFHFIGGSGEAQLFVLGIDISSRKQAEEAIGQARDAAERADRLKSEFLATMSHELRTPLNAIIGFSDALLTGTYGQMEPKQARKLEHILNSGKRLLALVDAVLDLSQIEAGRMKLRVEPTVLEPLLRGSLDMIAQSAAVKSIRTSLVLDSQDGKRDIPVDARKIKQVIFHLLSNAVKFTPQGGEITLSADLAHEDQELRVTVADNGAGFTPQEGKELFQAFYQADSTLSRQYEGTGLGLALCRRLVELHGGRIWAASQGRNQGSAFTFAIPLQAKPEENSPTDGAPESPPGQEQPNKVMEPR